MSSLMPSIVVSCHYGQNVWGALEHYFFTRKIERPDVPHNGFGDLFPFLILFVSSLTRRVLLKGRGEMMRKHRE